MTANNHDDETALTTDALQQGLKECIFTPFNVAHLSFRSQEKACHAVLPRYAELAQKAFGGKENEAPAAGNSGATNSLSASSRGGGSSSSSEKLKFLHHALSTVQELIDSMRGDSSSIPSSTGA